MRCGRAVFISHFRPQELEDCLKITCAGDNHAHFDHSQIEQKPKVIQIAIIERVFVVPLDFQADASLKAVDFVRRRIPLFSVYTYLGRELFLFPLTRRQKAIDPLSDDTLAAAALQQLATLELESSQGVAYVLPFVQVSGLQDTRRIPPFM